MELDTERTIQAIIIMILTSQRAILEGEIQGAIPITRIVLVTPKEMNQEVIIGSGKGCLTATALQLIFQ